MLFEKAGTFNKDTANAQASFHSSRRTYHRVHDKYTETVDPYFHPTSFTANSHLPSFLHRDEPFHAEYFYLLLFQITGTTWRSQES